MGREWNGLRWCAAAALLLAALQPVRPAWGREAPLARVIGGGTAALASSIELKKKGWRVEQFFPNVPPRQHLAVVSFGAARWLAAQGCTSLQPVEERGVFDQGALRRRRIALPTSLPRLGYPGLWIAAASTHVAPIATIEHALRERAASLGVSFFPGTRVLDVLSKEGGSRLSFDQPPPSADASPAQLVVDASGRGSQVRWSGVLPGRDVAPTAAELSSWMSLAQFDLPVIGSRAIDGSRASEPWPSQGQGQRPSPPGLADLLLFRVADPQHPKAVVIGGVQRYRDGRGQLSVTHRASKEQRPTPEQRDALLLAVMKELGLDGNTLRLETGATFWADLSRLTSYWNANPFAPVVTVGDRAIEPHVLMGSGVSSAIASAVLLSPLAAALQQPEDQQDLDRVRAAGAAFARQMGALADALVETAAAYLPRHDSWLSAFVPPSFATQP